MENLEGSTSKNKSQYLQQSADESTLIAQFMRLATTNIRSAIAQTMVHPGECCLEFEFGLSFEHRGIKIRAKTEGFLNISQSRCSDLWSNKASVISPKNAPALHRSLKRSLGACRKVIEPLLDKTDKSTTLLDKTDKSTTLVVFTFRAGEMCGYRVICEDNFQTSSDKYLE